MIIFKPTRILSHATLNLTTTKRNKHIVIFVLIALLFNSVGSLFAASSMLQTAQSYADEDTILICTGSTYKWISLKEFELTGKIEFVQPPENAPAELQDPKCTYAYLADPNTDKLWAETLSYTHVSISTSISIDYFGAVFATAKHRFSLSRAPPSFS